MTRYQHRVWYTGALVQAARNRNDWSDETELIQRELDRLGTMGYRIVHVDRDFDGEHFTIFMERSS